MAFRLLSCLIPFSWSSTSSNKNSRALNKRTCKCKLNKSFCSNNKTSSRSSRKLIIIRWTSRARIRDFSLPPLPRTAVSSINSSLRASRTLQRRPKRPDSGSSRSSRPNRCPRRPSCRSTQGAREWDQRREWMERRFQLFQWVTRFRTCSRCSSSRTTLNFCKVNNNNNKNNS